MGHSRRTQRRSASRNVRYASDCNRIDASRRNDAMCQEPTYALQQKIASFRFLNVMSWRSKNYQSALRLPEFAGPTRLGNPPDSDPVKPALRVRIAEPMSFDHS